MSADEGFVLTPWVALLFFRICRRYKVEGREARMALMRILAARKKAKYVRDIAPLLEGKRVLKITRKDTITESDN